MNALKAVLIPLLLSVTLHPDAHAWDLNDVSILMALPETPAASNSLLRTSEEGQHGPLFPRALFDRIGGINNASRDTAHIYENLRIVAFRFDPCPHERSDGQNCNPEIRTIWQPVVADPVTGQVTTEDAAIHAFYQLRGETGKKFQTALLELKIEMNALGISTDRRPLGIHPALTSSRTRSAFMKKLRPLLLNHLGENTLFKVTVMRLLVLKNWWKFFSGFEKDHRGQWNITAIPRQGGDQIDIINDATEVNPKTGFVDEIDASLFSLASYPPEDDLRPVVSTGFRRTFRSTSPDRADLPQFKIALGAIHRLQNPTRTNPSTVDCAHCHIADAAMMFAMKTFPELKTQALAHGDRFKNPDPARYNFSNSSAPTISTRAVRAFGYVDTAPSVMTRTIHESAQVAEYLNRQ